MPLLTPLHRPDDHDNAYGIIPAVRESSSTRSSSSSVTNTQSANAHSDSGNGKQSILEGGDIEMPHEDAFTLSLRVRTFMSPLRLCTLLGHYEHNW